METQEKNELASLLVLATKDPSRRDEFYRTLLESTIYIVANTDTKIEVDGRLHLAPGSKMSILKWAKSDGSTTIPFFSSLAAMEKSFDTEQPYLAMLAKSFFAETLGSNLVLDPLSDCRKEFSPAEIQYLLQTFVGKAVDAPSKVLLGQPADYPTKTIEALKKVFANYPQVKRVYLAQMQDQSTQQKPQLVVGIEGQGNLEPAFEAANSAILTSPPNQPIGLFQVNQGDQGLSHYFLTQSAPFYEQR